MDTLSDRLLVVGKAGGLSLLITAYGEGVWGVMVGANLLMSPRIPWSVPSMALLLWLMWQYLSGKWRPSRTSETRRRLLRARPVTGRVFGWALFAGVLSVVALTGYWIVGFQLVKMQANALPDTSGYPLSTIVPVLVMASLAAPFTEEAAFRGYCQVLLEQRFPWGAAVLLSSLFFALAHLTQGPYLPKLLVYFLTGAALGTMAYLTGSILPGIVAHFIGDMTFFTLVWPYDSTRQLIWDGGADASFWARVAQAIVFTMLAILAFRQLAVVAKRL